MLVYIIDLLVYYYDMRNKNNAGIDTLFEHLIHG
jgi:hypothetical protein